MNTRTSKIMSAVIVAAFCLAAFAVAFSDDSFAADKIGHNVYIEVINDDGITMSGYWLYFESENTPESFVENGSLAVAAAGLPLTIAYADGYISLTYEASFSNATYAVGSDGKWAAVNDTATEYPAAEKLYFALGNGYIATAVYNELSDAEKAKWTETGMGWGYDYVRNPQVQPTDVPETKDYHVFVEVIDAAGKVTSSKWVNFTGYKTPMGFVVAGNLAYIENELPLVATQKTSGAISIKYDGSGNNCTAYAKDGKWNHTNKTQEEYVEGDAVAFSVVHGYIGIPVYNALSDDEKKNWEESGMTYEGYEYQKVVTEDVDGYKEKKDSNIALYIGIGVGAVVVIGALAFFLLRKH